MSCPIHDRCTCYAASLQGLHYTASLTTSTGSSQLPQSNNIFVGYEWAAPLVSTPAAWYPLESVIIQPSTSYSGGNSHGAMPLHNSYCPEPLVYEREQKLAPSREQVCFTFSHTPFQAYPKLVCNSTHVSFTVCPGGLSNDHPQQSSRIASSGPSK